MMEPQSLLPPPVSRRYREALGKGSALIVTIIVFLIGACGNETGPTQTPADTVSAPTLTATATVKPESPLVPTKEAQSPSPTVRPGDREVVETDGDNPSQAAVPFTRWNTLLEPQPWWKDSEPYTCRESPNEMSPWITAGMVNLGGADPLSLIRYYGNGSYLRYGNMGFFGCTPMKKYPDATHLDPPVDPTYYSLGTLIIDVDIVRVPPDATGWFMDDGTRESMGMNEAVALLNTHVSAYYTRLSEGRLNMTFRAGAEFNLEGEASPDDVEPQHMRAVGLRDCRGELAASPQCIHGSLGGINRVLLTDVTVDSGGFADNGMAQFGLVGLRQANMGTIVHEIGHGWMSWPHSFAEVLWRPGGPEAPADLPNPYSNRIDMMSALTPIPILGWHADMPSTLAINRYAAGWIDPEEVALHVTEEGRYTLQPPRQGGNQFLVVSSGRPYAFTTLEVLEERNPAYVEESPQVYDSASPGQFRPLRYQGVFVSRYDQSRGTGTQARLGPALYDERNPNFESDVGRGWDDYSVIPDGETRDIGGGVRVAVSRNVDGSYEVTVTGGRVAPFVPWCTPIWFAGGEYDTGCALD